MYPFYLHTKILCIYSVSPLQRNQLLGGQILIIFALSCSWGRICLNGLQLLHLPDINPTQAPAKGEGSDTNSDTEIHNMANRRGIALKRGCKSISGNDASDGGGSGTEDDVRVDADLVDVLLELFA